MPRDFDMQSCDCYKAGAAQCFFVFWFLCLALKEATDNLTPPDQTHPGALYALGCLGAFCLGRIQGFVGRGLIETALKENITKKCSDSFLF